MTAATTIYPMMRPPENDPEALTCALMLALTAPDDERSARAVTASETIAARLDAATVEACKTAAVVLAHLVDARASLVALGADRDLNGDEAYHDAMRSLTQAAEALGVGVERFAALGNA